jgi:hypothetical protein
MITTDEARHSPTTRLSTVNTDPSDRPRGVPKPLRLLAVMRELDHLGGSRWHSLGELAAHTGYDKPGICRAMASCLKSGLVHHPALGMYALSEPVDPLLTSDEVHPLLADLHAVTNYPVLLYVPILLPGAEQRILASYHFGANRNYLLQSSPREHQEALLRAPLDADAAGLVIAAETGHSAAQTLQMQVIRDRGYTTSASPLVGLSLLAVPVRFTSGATGRAQSVEALALLVPDDDLDSTTVRMALGREVREAAERYAAGDLSASLSRPTTLAQRAS